MQQKKPSEFRGTPEPTSGNKLKTQKRQREMLREKEIRDSYMIQRRNYQRSVVN